MRDPETAHAQADLCSGCKQGERFSKLSRYETTIERSLYKALHELQRLQAARGAGGNISALVAVDIDVSGTSSEGL